MEELHDHTDAGVEETYEVSYIFERIVMNLHSLIDPLVGERQGHLVFWYEDFCLPILMSCWLSVARREC